MSKKVYIFPQSEIHEVQFVQHLMQIMDISGRGSGAAVDPAHPAPKRVFF